MMNAVRRLPTIAVGFLAGLVATMTLILLMVAGRYWLGISPPPEAIPDRIAPTLDIETFFSLFDRYGGYNGLKQFGIRSGILGLTSVGLLVGLIYPLVVESQRGRRAGFTHFGVSRAGVVFVGVTAIVLWIASVIVLWPVLDTNYRGLSPSSARPVTMVALLVYYLFGYGLTLIGSYHFMTARPALDTSSTSPTPTIASNALSRPIGRRSILAAPVAAALALPSYALLRRLYDRATFSYDGRAYSGPNIQPITPNHQFYSVTKNVVDPNVVRRIWRLEVNGHVENARTYSFDDLSAMETVEQETTLMCISNRIGSGLFSNAVWLGVPLRDLLMASGVRGGAVEVKLHGADSYTDTFTIEKALEPTTLVAFAMNGEPLPERNGYPVRVIVPGLYGEKNIKWVTRIEVADREVQGFYEQQGWGPNFVVPTRSDIFGPRWSRRRGGDVFVEPFAIDQTVAIRGRAFAGDRGIASVEFSADDGESWQLAAIDYPGTNLTWSYWRAEWRPRQPGEYTLLSRAIDGLGDPQPEERRGIIPQGATGYHRVVASVE